MKKVLIVFWSGTGNTEAMAKSLAQGAQTAGAEVILKSAADADTAMVKEAEALAFGCSAMGSEVLEENEMEPFIASLGAAEVGNKPLGLFGSYDWGDGQWMRDWTDRMKGLGAKVEGEGIITQLEPNEEALSHCYKLGAKLAE